MNEMVDKLSDKCNPKQTYDAMNGFQRFIKRLADIIGALIGLVLLSPVFLIVTLMLKWLGRGYVIFTQERI